MTKQELFKDLEEIKSDKLFVTDSLDNIEEEIKNNCWSISMSDDIANEYSIDELTNFLKDVKADRNEQLKNLKNGVRLIYYVWVDEQAGQLRFNFINSKHSKLPFGTPLTFTDKEHEILSDYLTRRKTAIKTVKVYKELIGE